MSTRAGCGCCRSRRERAADAAGIVEGDVLLTVDNKSVDSAAELDDVLGQLGARKSVAVLVQREEGPVFLALQLGRE